MNINNYIYYIKLVRRQANRSDYSLLSQLRMADPLTQIELGFLELPTMALIHA